MLTRICASVTTGWSGVGSAADLARESLACSQCDLAGSECVGTGLLPVVGNDRIELPRELARH